MTKNNTDPAKLLQREIAKKKRKAERERLGIKPKPRGKPFAPGVDERRNVKGSKPRTLALLREMILDMAGEEIKLTDPLSNKEETVTSIYYMLRMMMLGKAPADHNDILVYGFGKIADEVRNSAMLDEFIIKNLDLFTDGQIIRMKQGEDKMGIVAEVLRSAQEILKRAKKK